MGNIQSEAEFEELMTRYDKVSDNHDIILTYVISHLIKRHVVERITSKSQEKFNRAVANLERGPQECFSLKSGSKAEGLSVPEMYHVTKEGGVVAEASDDDFLIIDNVYVDNTFEMAIANSGNFYLDTSDTYPGFARIRVVDHKNVKPELLEKRVENGRDVYYMSKHSIQEIRDNEGSSTSMSGPAVSKDEPADVKFDQGEGGKKGTVKAEDALDLVYAVNIRQWPEFMDKWLARQTKPRLGRFSELPFGFFLVGAANRYSKDPDLEWRISCSLPELFFARQLTLTQKQVYMAFKYLIKFTTKGQKAVMTYHLKTTLFWTVEKTTDALWRQDNLAAGLYCLTDNLINFLASRYLPNYFIPTSNLLEHLSDDHITTALRSVMKLRENMLQCIMKYQQKTRLEGHSLWWHHAFENILAPHLTSASETLTVDLHPKVNAAILRRCVFDSWTDLAVAKLAEDSFEDTYDIMMAYLGASAYVRPEMKSLPRAEVMYNFLVTVCRKNFIRLRKTKTAVLFIDYVKRRLTGKGQMTDPIQQRLALMKACWSHITAKYTADAEAVESQEKQCVLVFESFQLDQDDFVTAAE